MFGFWGGNVFDIKDARHDLVDVPSRPRSRLMNAYSGTKLATARNRLRSLSADGVQWVLQEHLPGPVGLCIDFDTYASGVTLHPYPSRPSVPPATQYKVLFTFHSNVSRETYKYYLN